MQGEFGEGEVECMNNGCCAIYFKWTRAPEPGLPPGAAALAFPQQQRFFLQACPFYSLLVTSVLNFAIMMV